MAIAFKILSGLILLLGGFYLYAELEAAKIGAVSPFGYFGRIFAVIVLAVLAWVLARRIERRKAATKNLEEVF